MTDEQLIREAEKRAEAVGRQAAPFLLGAGWLFTVACLILGVPVLCSLMSGFAAFVLCVLAVVAGIVSEELWR